MKLEAMIHSPINEDAGTDILNPWMSKTKPSSLSLIQQN